MYTYDTKKNLRHDLRGQTIREVMVKGALADTREIELRLTNGVRFTITATTYGTLQIGAEI